MPNYVIHFVCLFVFYPYNRVVLEPIYFHYMDKTFFKKFMLHWRKNGSEWRVWENDSSWFSSLDGLNLYRWLQWNLHSHMYIQKQRFYHAWRTYWLSQVELLSFTLQKPIRTEMTHTKTKISRFKNLNGRCICHRNCSFDRRKKEWQHIAKHLLE